MAHANADGGGGGTIPDDADNADGGDGGDLPDDADNMSEQSQTSSDTASTTTQIDPSRFNLGIDYSKYSQSKDSPTSTSDGDQGKTSTDKKSNYNLGIDYSKYSLTKDLSATPEKGSSNSSISLSGKILSFVGSAFAKLGKLASDKSKQSVNEALKPIQRFKKFVNSGGKINELSNKDIQLFVDALKKIGNETTSNKSGSNSQNSGTPEKSTASSSTSTQPSEWGKIVEKAINDLEKGNIKTAMKDVFSNPTVRSEIEKQIISTLNDSIKDIADKYIKDPEMRQIFKDLDITYSKDEKGRPIYGIKFSREF